MLEEDAVAEIDEMERVRSIIRAIPQHRDYFLLGDFRSCIPAPLTQEDKTGFDNICTNFRSTGITSATINNNLPRMRIINMPFGGTDLETHWPKLLARKNAPDERLEDILQTVAGMSRLAMNGIIPANNLGLLHLDVKAANMLERPAPLMKNRQNVDVRLIDWGLAAIITGPSIPRMALGRPFQYNLPPAMVLLYKPALLQAQLDAVRSADKPMDPEDMRTVARRYVDEIVALRDDNAHLDSILSTARRYLTALGKPVPSGRGHVVDHLAAVLVAFTRGSTFNAEQYFHTVLARNADIYGFITSFAPPIDWYIRLRGPSRKCPAFQRMLELYNKYCLSPQYATRPIDYKTLGADLRRLYTLNNAQRRSSAACLRGNVARTRGTAATAGGGRYTRRRRR